MSKIGFTKEQWFKNYFPSCRSWLNMFKLCGGFFGEKSRSFELHRQNITKSCCCKTLELKPSSLIAI